MRDMHIISWTFPLQRAHEGILLGNGLLGAIVWGGGNKLRITVNRADFWDHRGHLPMTEQMSYANIRRLWEADDEKGMNALTRQTDSRSSLYKPEKSEIQPTALPMGRIELDFGKNSQLLSAVLNMRNGDLEIALDAEGTRRRVKLCVLVDHPLLFIESEDGNIIENIVQKPSYHFLKDHLKSIGFEPPVILNEPNFTGWIQARPADPHMCLACVKMSKGISVASVYGKTSDDAKKNAMKLVGEIESKGFAQANERSKLWWNKYWDNLPKVNLHSEKIEEIYYYGMFKSAGMTNPNGMAALLQGPWVEEYKMPECSNDYHFNINVQMCYWPVYAGNSLEHLEPLFKKIKEWEPIMRHNAKMLFGVDDALYLTMSVTDLGQYKKGFWPNLIDFSATGWIAHLMWLRFKYSMDIDFLRETAYPFMKGIMRTFEEVMEEKDGIMMIPLSTSPEYNEFTLKAGGKNPSIQLACVHFLLESLIESSELLNADRKEAEEWKVMREKIPAYSIIDSTNYECWQTAGKRIAIWDGQDLDWSHRHHSHLACIHPFDTLDNNNEEDWSKLLQPTIRHWIARGIAGWIGWSFPWASIICSRLGNAEAALIFLELWMRLFTNKGRGSVSYPYYGGLTSWTADPETENTSIHIDGAMGAVNAIQEMLLHTARGILKVFPAVPLAWKDVSFVNMRAEGAFLVSAERKNGKTANIKIKSEAGGKLKLYNNWKGCAHLLRNKQHEGALSNKINVIDTNKSDLIELIWR